MSEKAKSKESSNAEESLKPSCGIIMPISAIDGCSAEHWAEVRGILTDVIDSVGFIGKLVSAAEETSIIQKTIVQNIYNSDIVVCDVSGKNPNVMFELGLRLAFDKATIIIKDDHTEYSFDTSLIEHLTYPRDLRFNQIIEFKETLKAKITATYEKSKSDSSYSTFLQSFGEFKIAKLESKEVSREDYIVATLKDLQVEVRKLTLRNIGREEQSQFRFTGASPITMQTLPNISTVVVIPQGTEESKSVNRAIVTLLPQDDKQSVDQFKTEFKSFISYKGEIVERSLYEYVLTFSPSCPLYEIKNLLKATWNQGAVIHITE